MTQNQGTHPNYKFGGASNSGSYQDIIRIIDLVGKTPQHQMPLLVFSARGKTTKRLRKAYDLMLQSEDERGERQARWAAHQIFDDHLACVLGVFRRSAQAPRSEMINSERQKVSVFVSILKGEVDAAFDLIKANGKLDPHEKAKAIIESVGERLTTVGLMGPAFRIHGRNTLILPSLRFMRAKRSARDTNTDAVLDWEASRKAFEEEYNTMISHLISGTVSSTDPNAMAGTPTVLMAEGFIARNEFDEIVTLGNDNSDLSKVFLAWARHQMANGSATGRPVATLWKVIDPSITLRGNTIEHLHEYHGDLVSPIALQGAIKHQVDIGIGNVRTGMVKIYGPIDWAG